MDFVAICHPDAHRRPPAPPPRGPDLGPEPPHAGPPDRQRPAPPRRRATLRVRPRGPRPRHPRATDDLDRIVIALSSALGIESLPPDEAEPLLDAFNRGILELGEPFALWGAVGLDAPRAPRLSTTSSTPARSAISLPARALADRRGLRHVAPLLDRLEARGAPLFVHPGPATVAPSAPAWWPALTSYVADMSAAWHAFATWGRPCHPQLRIVYAMLAGGAPLHAERLVARGGPGRRDPRPARLVRRLLLRAARARRDDPHGRGRPPALRLRPPRRRAACARRARRCRRARPDRSPTPGGRSPRAPRCRCWHEHAGAQGVRAGAGDEAGELAPSRRARPRGAHVLRAAARRQRRGLADLLDGRARHRLPRPRRLRRRGRRRLGQRARGPARARRGAEHARARPRQHVLLRAVGHPPRAARGQPSRPSRSTRTRRRCGGWAPTRSTPRGACCATRSPTPRSSGRSGLAA